MAPKSLDQTQPSQQSDEDQPSTNNDQPGDFNSTIQGLSLLSLALMESEQASLNASVLQQQQTIEALQRELKQAEELRDGILPWKIDNFRQHERGSEVTSSCFYSKEDHKMRAKLSIGSDDFLSISLTLVNQPSSSKPLAQCYESIAFEIYRLNDDPLRSILRLRPADDERSFQLSPEHNTVSVKMFVTLEEIYEKYLFEESELSIMIKLLSE